MWVCGRVEFQLWWKGFLTFRQGQIISWRHQVCPGPRATAQCCGNLIRQDNLQTDKDRGWEMNCYSCCKAERSPGLQSSRHSMEMTLCILIFSKFNTQNILYYLQKLKESIARSGGKGMLLKRWNTEQEYVDTYRHLKWNYCSEELHLCSYSMNILMLLTKTHHFLHSQIENLFSK